MNAINGLENRDQAKALFIFFVSERERHIDDVVTIDKLIDRLIGEWGFNRQEIAEMQKCARKFIKLDDGAGKTNE
jgi:hypothetical protein